MTDIQARKHTIQTDADQREFDELAIQWRANTLLLSDSARAIEDEHYRAIVAMGNRAVIPMLRDLQGENPGHWFEALQEITGENPVKPKDAGYIDRMAAAWIEWGRTRGYIS